MKLLVVALSLFISSAYACSCGEWGSAREMLSGSKAAFVGTVVATSLGEISPDSGEPLALTKFLITTSFKPRGRRSAMTRSEVGDGGNCGTNFAVGESYLLFAYEFEGKIYTDLCSIQPINGSRTQNIFLRDLYRASRLPL